jgi:hypothetical protein
MPVCSVPIIHLQDRHERKAEERKAQASILVTAQCALVGAAAIAFIGFVFITETVPAGKREALRNQEQIHARR